MDRDGLTNIYMMLGQIDEAIKSHREDAAKFDALHGTHLEESLSFASGKMRGTQMTIQRVLNISHARESRIQP